MDDAYKTAWDAREYLQQYYATMHVTEDERANFAFASRQFARTGRRFHRAVEIGCGPTLHHAALLAPHVEHLVLADYLRENLDQVRRALAGEPGAHDWSVYFSGLPNANEDPMAAVRAKVKELRTVNVRHALPLGNVPPFDLVASYYCLECVSGERNNWRQYLSNVSTLVAPGGVLLLSALRRCREYHVLNRSFPTAFVDETDFAAVLPTLGFDSTNMVIETVAVAEWAGQGFDSICCVWAEKRS